MSFRIGLIAAGFSVCWIVGCGVFGGVTPPASENAGTVEGYVYRRAVSGSQVETGNNFILSATANPSLGSPPVEGTRALLSSISQFGTTDADGHFTIPNVPTGVYSLTVVEETATGDLLSDIFPDILVVPNATTHGAVPPEGLSVVISSAGGTTVEAGQSLSLSAELRTADNQPVAAFDDFTWTSSIPSMASVDSQGTVHGLNAGTTTIQAAAGPVVGSIDIAVTGSIPSVAATIDFASAVSADGDHTRVGSLSIDPSSPASLSLPTGAFFLFNNPDGSVAGSPSARAAGNGVELSSPVSLTGTTGRATILLQASEDFQLSGSGGWALPINRFLWRFDIFSAGATNLPPGGVWQIPPPSGTTGDLSFSFSGLPPDTQVTVALTLEGGAQVQATGSSGAGPSVTLDAFSPEMDMSNVVAITCDFETP